MGPHMRSPIGERLGVPYRVHSEVQMYFCISVQPVPPYSTGQLGATQPFL